MSTGKFFLLLFWTILMTVSYCQIVHTSKIFLTPQEDYLFFPHRNFQLVSTYTSNCSAKPLGVATYHSAMSTVAQIAFNNSNLGINILSQQATSTVFYYAKINVNGICTVYEVDQQQIRILYESNFSGEFTHVVLLDRFHAFLWNCEHFVRVQYSMYSHAVNVVRGKFEIEDSWNCKKYKEGVILCWGQNQITLIEMYDASFTMEAYEWNKNETIRVMLPLDINQDIFFICSFTRCNITQLLPNHTIVELDTFPFVQQILGADFNVETSQIVIIHPATAIIFTYYSRAFSIRLVESLDFYSDLQCVFIQNVRFLNEHILVNCNNFMGEAQHLALIKDRQLNRFFSYQPLRDSDPANPCLFDGNQKYIFALCKTQIVTMLNNFAYFQFNQVQSRSAIIIQCLDVDEDVIKIPENFELTFISAQYGKAYVNQKVQNISISFDYPLTVKLKDKFTAAAIDHYTIASPYCPYLSEFYVSNIDAQYFVSLYIKQNCVQITASGNRNFYRVLQINETLFYIEMCTLVKEGFGCQLDEIIENVSNFRLIELNQKIFKLYIRDGNLMIVDGGLIDIIFQDVSLYQMRDQIIRVKSHNKFFSNSVSNVVNNCGAWIEEQEHFLYVYSQYDIFKINSQGSIFKYRDSVQTKINIQLPITTFSPQIRPFSLPFLLCKGYYLFVINQTHITKLYDFQTTIVIYELPYNPQGYQIQSIRSVDNYFTIQYKLGFFQIYNTDRESLAALIAVQQQEIIHDIVLMDKDVILVPLKQQTYLIRIQTDPSLHINQFPSFFNKFRQECAFIITPHLSNGSCLDLDPPVTQTMNLRLKFMIQKIVLSSQTLQIYQPRKCQNCTFQIPQQQFLGPIFNYEFHDDDFGTFTLLKHLNVESCDGEVEKHLLRMFEVHNADDKTRIQLLMMNATHTVLFDQQLNQIYSAALEEKILCVSYTRIQYQYLLLCQQVFILFGKNDTLIQISHNISLNNYPVQPYSIKSQQAKDQNYYIFIREAQIMHVGLISLKTRQIQFISQQQLFPEVMDFALVRDNIITLEDGQICISTNMLQRVSCFSLDTIIPLNFAYDYDYDQFLAYHVSDNYLRTLLISKTNQNLHVDIEIDLQAKPIGFSIKNVYAGYVGYTLRGIVSIDSSENGSYSNFLLHYQDTKDAASLIAYYPFNHKFIQTGEIGHIRSALFLTNYFQMATSFTFLSFPNKLYVANSTQLASPTKQYKKCLSVQVQNQLKVVTTYNQPSLLKFLILKVNNINDIQNYYIKITYSPEDGLVNHSLISLAITLSFFIVLTIAINRCHEVDSQTTIHFMSEDIEGEFSEENPSDLLHSNSSASSPRSYSPPEFNEQPE